jgi:hypothetical protein
MFWLANRPGDVLLVTKLMPFAVEALGRAVRMLDGRDPAVRGD